MKQTTTTDTIVKNAIKDFGNLLASSEPVRTIEDKQAYEKAIKILYEKIESAISKTREEAYRKGILQGCKIEMQRAKEFASLQKGIMNKRQDKGNKKIFKKILKKEGSYKFKLASLKEKQIKV